jgi:type IV pilus biogenesis protein CpaD/CtpE
MRTSPILPLLFALTAALTACAHNTDLIAKLNEEPLGNTNASNIAAMVANPADLVRGHGGVPTGAVITSLPIERIQMDRPKGLPGSGGGSGGGGGSAAAGGGASGG